MKPLFVIISIGVSNPKFTPAKLAFAGTVFSATVAEVFTPVASGFAMAWVNDPLKSWNAGDWFSRVIGNSIVAGGMNSQVTFKVYSPVFAPNPVT